MKSYFLLCTLLIACIAANRQLSESVEADQLITEEGVQDTLETIKDQDTFDAESNTVNLDDVPSEENVEDETEGDEREDEVNQEGEDNEEGDEEGEVYEIDLNSVFEENDDDENSFTMETMQFGDGVQIITISSNLRRGSGEKRNPLEMFAGKNLNRI